MSDITLDKAHDLLIRVRDRIERMDGIDAADIANELGSVIARLPVDVKSLLAGLSDEELKQLGGASSGTSGRHRNVCGVAPPGSLPGFEDGGHMSEWWEAPMIVAMASRMSAQRTDNPSMFARGLAKAALDVLFDELRSETDDPFDGLDLDGVHVASGETVRVVAVDRRGF